MVIRQELSRRSLLLGGAGAALLTAVSPLRSQAGEPDVYTVASWLPLVGSTLTADSAIVKMERVVDLRKAPIKGEVADAGERFRLHLSLVQGAFTAGTMTILHPVSGGVPLFLTNSGATAVAVIDRRGAAALPPPPKDNRND